MKHTTALIVTGTIAITAIWCVLYVTLSLGALGLIAYVVAVAVGCYIMDSLNISRIWEK